MPNKKSGKTAAGTVLSLLLTGAFSIVDIACSGNPQKTPIAPTDVVSSDMMKEDFEYVVGKLKSVHPSTNDGFSEPQRRIISGIRDKIRQPMTKEEFFFLVNDLFHSFRDAHTTQWLVFSLGIDFPVLWLQDGLYVDRDTELLKKGDFVLSVGGREAARLFERLKQIVWTENDHLVRLEGTWMLSARPYLRHMGLIKNDKVEVACRRAGRIRAFQLPIIRLERRQNDVRPFMAQTLDASNDLAVLTLNSCRYDSDYCQELEQFFIDVHSHNIGNVVLDLRRNDGGDSRVIDEFLPYIAVDRIKTYGSFVRYSHDARMKTKVLKFGSEEFPRCDKINAQTVRKALRFAGRLFVLASPNTFSSANMFAATIQDNRIGIIVGEPTGNQPSCFGHPLSFQMPRTGLYFKISHKRFFRPEASKDRIDAVYPDVEVYQTMDAILDHRDIQMEKIVELIAAHRPQPDSAGLGPAKPGKSK